MLLGFIQKVSDMDLFESCIFFNMALRILKEILDPMNPGGCLSAHAEDHAYVL
jgi:hypothetical protein